MAIDSNGKNYEYRELQFYGLAYGNNNVSLTTTINGNIVFSGEVPTINSVLPMVDVIDEVPLFSLKDSQLFPTNQQGSYAVSITVSGGYGAIFGKIYSNYEHLLTRINDQPVAVLANCSIEGNTLTIGSIISGNVATDQLLVLSNNHDLDTQITAGSGLTWTVNNNNQAISDANILAYGIDYNRGTATDFREINLGSEISDVIIDGVAQPINPPFTRYGLLIVPSGSTISYNLSVKYGSCSQS
jgi:hypothetical protein